jgi:hypothetical protein
MSKLDFLHSALEKEFESTLSAEIIPGILHNFANPLNGIMGRSKLLQRKLEMNAKTAVPADPDDFYNKIFRDVDLISRDTERLSVLLQNVAEKFYTISKTSVQRLNLSEIIAIEMGFFDFFLEFKHNIKKTLNLNPDIPEVTGIPADYSLSLWVLIRESMARTKDCEPKEMSITTEHRGDDVNIRIATTGVFFTESDWSEVMDAVEKEDLDHSTVNARDSYLVYSLFLLKNYGARFRLESEGGVHNLTIAIPVN